MDRRTAISRVAIILGSTIIGSELFISGCKNAVSTSGLVLSDAQISFLNEVAETILPKTAASGGAKAANVGTFMQTMLKDCYSAEERDVFFKGLTELEQASKEMNKKGFLESSPEERHNLLVKLDADVKAQTKQTAALKQKELEKQVTKDAVGNASATKEIPSVPYFAMIKQLTLLGYFTSEIGYKSQGYVPIPGRYDGDVVNS